MQQPFIVDQQQLFCRVSVGVAVYPDDADNADTLVSKADQAMYEVKRSGRNGWQFYTHEMQDKSERRHRLFNDICAALERGDLSVHYQPIIALATGRISGCEALVRWCREGDWVPPVEFVTVAEETGLISQLDNFVIGRAMTDMSALTDQLATPLTLSVNISPRVFLARDETLQAMLAMKASLSEHLRVSVEITERMLVEDAERAANALMVLRDAGVGVSIDDFGTGYSALGYLARYPVDVVKIDRSFVSGIGRGTADEALIEIILLFAKRLGIAVVAEGVETEEQYTFLANKGCTYAQGYLLGRPMPLEAFGAFVQGRQPLRPGSA
jgi:EAL domain-containing protein (putative c-di-GMP-specific phosphodiesterase class I)